MTRKTNLDQLGLFAPTLPQGPAPVRQCPPIRGRKSNGGSAAGNPAVVKDILAEVHEGRYGLLDDTDRVMVFEDRDRVRTALDEEAVLYLLNERFIERCSPRDTVTCLHGVIRRPVLPLRLTATGRQTLTRWSNLRPLEGRFSS